MQYLARKDFTAQRWKNGGGTTFEIHRVAAAAPLDFSWRLSRAIVETDGPFSLFPHHQRILALVSGAGVTLTAENGEAITVSPQNPIIAFSGAVYFQSRRLAGAVEDINLMYDPKSYRAAMKFMNVEAAQAIAIEADEGFIVMAEGAAEAGAQLLGEGDVLLFTRGESVSLKSKKAKILLGLLWKL